ncbi:MAG: hypothetical protein HOH66_03595 [Rhodospirillaceae bacterium]|jgi:adenylate cyclase|nr:hypothetical protein [Rhodospirillaceae bacterium]MBT6116926.1 hypothetical protein [Rhodospirillaceae bacterium]
MGRAERKLAAIVAADMVGFSAQMEADDLATLGRLKDARNSVVDPLVDSHGGRVFKTTGDGFIAEFGSAVDALSCAVAIQAGMAERNAGVERDRACVFRIGLSLGDVVVEEGDVFGDGVNVAARLEPLAPPGGIAVSGVVRDQARNRTAARFQPLGPRRLKNIADTVEVYLVQSDAVPAAAGEDMRSRHGEARPTLAVLPFEDPSGSEDREHIADGLTEDLITTLSQIDALSVIGRKSAFAYKNRTVTAKEVGWEVGAGFVLTGGARVSGDRVRVTVQLTDAVTEALVWSARYDRRLEDIFGVQDEIVLTIATALQVELTEGEQAALRYTTVDNVSAWIEFTKGIGFFRTVSQATYRSARAAFERALKHDPDSAQIHAMLSCTHAIEARFDWTEDRGRSLDLAKEHADRALALDPENADAWGGHGYRFMCLDRLEDSAEAYGKAVALAPGHADLHALHALALTFAGRAEEAVREAETAMRLNPLDPGWYCGVLGHAYRYAGRLDDAIATLTDYDRRSPGFGLVDLVLAYADKGEPEAAAVQAQRLLAARPAFTIEAWAKTQNGAEPDRLARDRASLAAAGLP